MNQEHPLLSICIPTYNGAGSSLDLVLEAAVRIANSYDNIEIVVSDNCSTDNTRELVQSFVNKYTKLRYYRNDTNLGFNGNVLKLANYSKGEYTWMTGDDDVINLETFGSIYETLKEGLVDYISVGFRFAFKEEFDINGNGNNLKAIVTHSSFDEVLLNNCNRGNTLATFMGSSIFRTLRFRAVDTSKIENKFDCYYNCFPNSYIVTTAFHKSKCAYIQTPCIICVSPRDRKKGYASLESWAIIDTKAIVELYDYYISLGIDPGCLKRTENRIIYDNIITRTKLLLTGKRDGWNYCKYLLKSLTHPVVLKTTVKRFSNMLLHTKFAIDV